ncbi:hypothetical protein B9N43_02455 [Denitratisoma sp. DHT3]|uniref:DmsC/YnfH family molybdoenzyme membrane anchor subunit n=1 Tax=Denitratisoma sp. DHT3 TaxID=1981880 RepID=UPI00119885DC|nr:DmsC/YnfH family molybdoenzyme membrane anchor subunit [Denitratisoma sp. DHT3]QDX80221.1 hypothetical protein B9N43_02455 [Denitratisoma sp. DHT3]
MLAKSLDVVGSEFRVGYRMQKSWGMSMATAFFFGEAGAGLYFVSQFYDLAAGMLLGLLMVIFGKGGGHLLHLGKPSRGWRAFTRVGSSWISRGLWAITLFAAFGALHLLDLQTGLLPRPLSALAAGVAVAGCLVIMVYQGFAMSHSSSITLWSSGLMPLASLTYALLNGVMLTLVIGHDALATSHPEALPMLRMAAVGLVLYGFVMVLSLVHSAKYGSGGGRKSVELLLRGAFSGYFLPVVLVLGFVVSGTMLAFAAKDLATMILVAGCELTGYYAFRVLMFKAGTYDPVLSFAPKFKP